MRSILTCLLLAACCSLAFAQGSSQQIDLDGADAVHVYAAFSSVEITTGGTDALNVLHGLVLDGEDRSDLRNLKVERNGSTITISEVKPTAELLREQINGSRHRENWSKNTTFGQGTINGVEVDATLKLTVPAGIKVTVETEYGSIRAVDSPGLLSARAKYGAVDVIYTSGVKIPNVELYSNYGAVDVTIPNGYSLNLDLTTQYGDLLTDLDIAMDKSASEERDFYQHVVGKLGTGGAKINCEAPYGNVYLRAL